MDRVRWTCGGHADPERAPGWASHGCGHQCLRGDATNVDRVAAERDGPTGVVGCDGPGPAGPSIHVSDAMIVVVVDHDVTGPDLVSADGGHGCRSLRVGSLPLTKRRREGRTWDDGERPSRRVLR